MLPRTIDEALNTLIGKMDSKAKIRLARMGAEDLIYLHPEFGVYISCGFQLIMGNPALLTACRDVVGMEELDEEGASFLIFAKLWEKVKATSSLRVVSAKRTDN